MVPFLTVEGYFLKLLGLTFLRTAIQNISNVIHVSHEARLRAVDCRESQGFFKLRNLCASQRPETVTGIATSRPKSGHSGS